MKFRERGFSGTLDPEISKREKEHAKLIRRAASEGIVLLENHGVLPLEKGTKVALYGGGARYTIIGGTGSGSVNNRKNVNIDEGLRNAGLEITTDDWLDNYDAVYKKTREQWIRDIYAMSEPGDFFSLYNAYSANPMPMPEGKQFVKTEADIAIYVISRISGESVDRRLKKGDYYLSEVEEQEITELSGLYPQLILVLNVGGVMDLSFMDKIPVAGLVVLSQAGMEGGNALGDVLTGKVNPCGHLTDTWAYRYEDYPCSDTFGHRNGNTYEELYKEGIYVGYRYFDSFNVKARYPFGFGRSYTEFSMQFEDMQVDEDTSVQLQIKVKNEGTSAGKQVVQIYAACPQGKKAKERKRLVGFEKTGNLAPGETETVKIIVPLEFLESYDTGHSSYYLDKGAYGLFMGENICDCKLIGKLVLSKKTYLQKLTSICPLHSSLKEFKPDATVEEEWWKILESIYSEKEVKTICIDTQVQMLAEQMESRLKKTDQYGNLLDEYLKKDELDIKKKAVEVLAQMTRLEKAKLVCGQPSSGSSEVIGSAAIHVPGAAGETSSALEKYGIGELILADGPAGLRLQQRYEENTEDGSIYRLNTYEGLENRFFGTEFCHEGAVSHYQFCSAIPVGTMLAQTFDRILLKEIGELVGREMKEFGVTLWLAPGMNIHRNPLCGRNFEYYSEDPVLSGNMAAAITRGVQSIGGIGTTIKHYACNNQEDNRMGVDGIVSERALREIYLKGFEIAIKASQPMAMMTSYNRINSVHSANNYDLCTVAARKEWGFKGMIMTDWLTTNDGHGSSAAKCVQAGNDLTMPGNVSDIYEIYEALDGENDQYLEEADLDQCVLRILETILRSDVMQEI